MIYQTKEMITKDNEKVIMRSPRMDDAEKMLDYIVAMCGETEFVGRYPEEVVETLDEERELLEKAASSENEILISVFTEDGKLVGNASIVPYSKRMKIKHRADFGIAVLKPFWGKGIGKMLTNACLEMAEQMGYTMQ